MASLIERDTKLQIFYEDASGSLRAAEGAKEIEYRDKFFVVRRVSIQPISRKVQVRDIAQFFTRNGVTQWLTSQGLNPQNPQQVEWKLGPDAPPAVPSPE